MSTTAQFITIIVGILAGIFLNNRALDRLEDRMEAKFAKAEERNEARLSKLEERNEARLAKLEERNEARLTKLEDRMNTRFNSLDGRIDRIFGELGTFHSIQGEHKSKIDILERKQGL